MKVVLILRTLWEGLRNTRACGPQSKGWNHGLTLAKKMPCLIHLASETKYKVFYKILNICFSSVAEILFFEHTEDYL